MEIDKQLFEDVLSGKLKGTFVLSNDITVNSDKLFRAGVYHPGYAFRGMSYIYDCNGETPILGCSIVDFIPDTDMKENELAIEIPDGKIVDWDESKKQNKIVLKDKQLTYEDVCKKLFKDVHYSIGWEGYPVKCSNAIYIASNAATEHQLECILAKNKLATVAKYLNDGWKPNKGDIVFTLTFRGNFENSLVVGKYYFGIGENQIIFKTQKVAQQAIEILGEEVVKLALEPLGV